VQLPLLEKFQPVIAIIVINILANIFSVFFFRQLFPNNLMRKVDHEFVCGTQLAYISYVTKGIYPQ